MVTWQRLTVSYQLVFSTWFIWTICTSSPTVVSFSHYRPVIAAKKKDKYFVCIDEYVSTCWCRLQDGEAGANIFEAINGTE